MKQIPHFELKKLGAKYGFDNIILLAYDSESDVQNVATWGKSDEQSANAAKAGNFWKKQLDWPEKLCNEKPDR